MERIRLLVENGEMLMDRRRMRVLDLRGLPRTAVQEEVRVRDSALLVADPWTTTFDRLFVEGEFGSPVEEARICPHEPRHRMLAVRVARAAPGVRRRQFFCIVAEDA